MASEIVVFRLQPTITQADFLKAVDETTDLLKTQHGFISRNVSLTDSGEWLDILSWESIEDAKAAVTIFQTEPAGKHFSEYMDPHQIQVFYAKTVVEFP